MIVCNTLGDVRCKIQAMVSKMSENIAGMMVAQVAEKMIGKMTGEVAGKKSVGIGNLHINGYYAH